jgi:hypothetical protein
LQKEVEDPLSTEILKGKFKEGDSVEIDVRADKVTFHPLPGKEAAKKGEPRKPDRERGHGNADQGDGGKGPEGGDDSTPSRDASPAETDSPGPREKIKT